MADKSEDSLKLEARAKELAQAQRGADKSDGDADWSRAVPVNYRSQARSLARRHTFHPQRNGGYEIQSDPRAAGCD